MCVSLLFILILLLILIIRNKIIEKFNNNKTYYLIANNPKILPKNFLNFIKNDENITYVFFNHCEILSKLNFNQLKNFNKMKCKKILFCRANHLKSYWGDIYFKNQKINLFNKDNTFIIDSDNANMNIIKNPFNLPIIFYKKYISKNLINTLFYKKQPQTGFISYHYLKYKDPQSNIILCNFTRKNGEDGIDFYHNKTKELIYYKNNNIKSIII